MTDFSVLDLLDLDLKEHNHLQLTCIAGRSGLSRKITNTKISRPGLPLSGFFEEFSHESIQVFGRGEQQYVKMLESQNMMDSLEKIFSYPIPACVYCDKGFPSSRFIEIAERSGCAVLQTALASADFSRGLYQMLDEIFAPTITIHGVLVEVYGIGVLITGDSGVGKSETALELIERGHRLISDDTVKLRNISDMYLIGTGENPLLAHHMEIRGLGIINLANLFGVGSIRDKKQVQLLVHLEEWDPEKAYDRIGEELNETLLGISVPKLQIPVKPGRNVPIIIETAARNERLKKLGYYSAKEFDQSVLKWLESESARNLYYSNEETF
ncbi:MAG: HPr(Ser) kinase/phosphatase [Sphaerochaetaceae bacterium]|jgi:HPr kinase/phosphorylase|nr:HPr(Ser) kinase/phosphatase [Sphaerochaetaceae bacterium]NLO60423.1 HPr kinase/phosphorylase [Spirochaetales bacterium]MDD3670132.1 HPr(Ser) kinase/phosphatase [Sphaerochaetaceae bacterium]MDD4259588.1 HPr(Ser) kinase/phosphatase [Sphaerochaetaceae bacterium]MDD4762531.1 HPr(Ser) kinase/phosphatase [Sphaerochaetaceae bacterium]